MRMIAITTQTPRKQLDRSARRAEKQGHDRRMMPVQDPIRAIPFPRTEVATIRSAVRLTHMLCQAILTHNGRPHGECRLKK